MSKDTKRKDRVIRYKSMDKVIIKLFIWKYEILFYLIEKILLK